MRFILTATAALLAISSSAYAGCRNELALYGNVDARDTDDRGFTLTRGKARLRVYTHSGNNQLSWEIYRPNGSRLNCAQRGPSDELVCFPEVARPGYYEIKVINRMRRSVEYTVECNDR